MIRWGLMIMLGVLTVLAASGQLREWWVSAPVETAKPPQAPRADYEMQQFQARVYDAQGELRGQIAGARLRHFVRPTYSLLKTAQMEIIDRQGARWRIHSERARLRADQSLLFPGPVRIERPQQPQFEPLAIQTADLEIDNQIEVAKSPAPAALETLTAQLSGTGLEIQFGPHTWVELKQDVRGRYVR